MILDLTGQRYKKLTVKQRSIQNPSKWICICDCGNEVEVTTSNLRSGNTKSCGCARIDNIRQLHVAQTKHGLSHLPEYRVWEGMIYRCTAEQAGNYQNYGGRGITVCQRWMDSFENFLADMGPRPGDEYSIDRFPDGDGPYQPGNCRWATAVEQNSNRRGARVYEYRGKMYTARELAAECGIANVAGLTNRLSSGWDVERAVTTPLTFGRWP
jgi:hypothetical protein